MLSFESDYTEGAHESILRRLIETNYEQLPGYGNDKYCDSAKEKIREAAGCPDADVFLIAGGTQTNMIVIDTVLAAYEGVLCAETGHIHGHEAGAVEYTGHKVLTLPQKDGKLSAADAERYLQTFFADENHAHMVQPAMLYISHPTEYGTLYTLDELKALREVCDRHGQKLFLDGARLGYGLMSEGTDVTLQAVASLCDVFYVGGTKVGALCGEAVVFPKGDAPAHFFTSIKQHGALLAKGRLLGVQFDTLFTDRLYFEIAKNAIDKADRMRDAFASKGYTFHIPTTTNQIFVVLDNEKMRALREHVRFGFWEKYDDAHTVVRFASSWATTDEQVDRLIALL